MGDHRMVRRPADLAADRDGLGLGLDAVELDAVVELHQFAAIEPAEEIEVPPRAAELAVGHRLKADRLLFRDDLLDFAVFDGGRALRR